MRTSARRRLHHTMIVAGLALLTLTFTTGWTRISAVTAGQCSALNPTSDATLNYTNISECLTTYGYAYLNSGVFPVSQGIYVPANAQLLGNSGWPTIRLMNRNSNRLIEASTATRVGFLTLDANNQLLRKQNSAVVHIWGSDNFVDNNHIFNSTASGVDSAGVYVICAACTNNSIYNNQIRWNFNGVLFAGSLNSSHQNKAESNQIYENKCDAVGLPGYGRVLNNTIYRNGWNCENGPIPGAGVYALNNKNGAEVSGNTIYDSCGNNVDLDGVANFVITNNTISQPGYLWNGQYTYCGGAASIFLMDVSHSRVEGNTVTNNDRSWNRMSRNPNDNVFSSFDDHSYSDLPHGGKQTIAFVLARRPGVAGNYVVGNTIRNNVFQSSCAPVTNCVGLGYFSSRRTGFGVNDTWDSTTTNFYMLNNPNGSQVGSRRAGGNWYAANSTCTATSSPPDCNLDDYQHNAPNGDWARNDFRALYGQ